MEFFRGIHDGTYQRLADDITAPRFIDHFEKDVQQRLAPLLIELETMEVAHNTQRIKVHIEVDRSRLYETGLKKLSEEGIIFDIIQDDDDIRDTYLINDDPGQICTYLMRCINEILNRYTSAEQEKIRRLESRLKELENVVLEKNQLLYIRDLLHQDQDRRDKEQQEEIAALAKRNHIMEEMLSKYRQEEEETGNVGKDESASIKDGKLRMYFLYKLGFLDNAIWNEGINYGQRARILCKVLEGNPITQVSALRYYKLFNSTGSTELKQYEADNEHKILGYMKNICPNVDFQKGKFVNDIKKNKR